ncbi:MAG: RluA family pseudouridine synthase [Lachnospiraceae bacterium]|nr:RluA family pseudouridine synthase [Lachnospiraceae bacterium]
MQPKILYEDDQILVVYKPVGVATQTAKMASQDMVSIMKNYLVRKGSLRDPYLGVVHRLDQPVSGILVFGKTKAATAALSSQIGQDEAGKEYLALCLGRLSKEEGTLIHYLKKNKADHLATVTDEKDKEGKRAELSYRVIERRENSTLVRIRLKTGRFHQIRAQFLAAGHPLLGDRKYKTADSEAESSRLKLQSVALCAVSLSFTHPGDSSRKAETAKEMNFTLDREDLPLWENEASLP